jgi:hypothetical protein
LDFTGDTNEPIVQKMLNRLQRAIADDDMRHKMDFEDEIERILEREAKKVSAEKDQIIAKKDEALAEKDQVLAKKDEALAEKDEALAEKDAEIEALRLIIASTNKE